MPVPIPAAVLSLLVLTASPGLAEAVSQKTNAILCETEDQAIDLARLAKSGKPDWIAVDRVNKKHGKEACGRYIGRAVIESEKTENVGGSLFMLAGLRFMEDGRLAWTASWITPFTGASLERRT